MNECPKWTELCRWEQEGDGDGGIGRHVSECRGCRRSLEELRGVRAVMERTDETAHEEMQVAPYPPGPRVRTLFPFLMQGATPPPQPAFSMKPRRAVSAAAALLLSVLVGLVAADRFGKATGENFGNLPLSVGKNVVVKKEQAFLHSGQGSFLTAHAGTEFRRLPDRDKRTRLRMTTGRVSVSVRPGGKRLEIETPLGTVRDIGTEFDLSLGEVRCPPSPRREADTVTLPVMTVSVREGKVQVDRKRERGSVRVGHTAFVTPATGMFFQQTGEPLRERRELIDILSRFRVQQIRGDRLHALQTWLSAVRRRPDEPGRILEWLKDGRWSGAMRELAWRWGAEACPREEIDGLLPHLSVREGWAQEVSDRLRQRQTEGGNR